MLIHHKYEIVTGRGHIQLYYMLLIYIYAVYYLLAYYTPSPCGTFLFRVRLLMAISIDSRIINQLFILHSSNTKKWKYNGTGYQLFNDVKKHTSTIQVRREVRYNIIAGLVQPTN
jgi:hypothetical protein